MASYAGNIRTKNYHNLIIGFLVTAENVGDVFLRHNVLLLLCGFSVFTQKDSNKFFSTSHNFLGGLAITFSKLTHG